MHLKISSVKWQPFCPGGDELIVQLGVSWIVNMESAADGAAQALYSDVLL